MRYLLDTNAISDLMIRHPGVAAKLSGLPEQDRAVICTVVRGEILHGIQRLAPGRRRDTLQQSANELLAVLPCEPLTSECADHYARLRRTQETRGLRLDDNDLWIAATALTLGATLISRDQDVRRIEELTVEDWSR